MQELNFAFQIVLPMFVIIAVGYLLRILKLWNQSFLNQANDLVFNVFFPILLFTNLYQNDLAKAWSGKVMSFIVLGVLGLYLVLMIIVPLFEKKQNRKSVIIQALYRANYLLFGMPICQMLYGQEGAAMASVIAAVLVPLFSALAVIVLAIYDHKGFNLLGALKSIVQNPLIWGAALGILFRHFSIGIPSGIYSGLESIAGISTAFALLVLGGDLEFKLLLKNAFTVSVTTFIRLFIVPAAMLSIAYFLGFRGLDFVAMISVFAAPVSVSSYVMAKNAGADGELAGQLVVSTSIVSIFSLFLVISLSKFLSII